MKEWAVAASKANVVDLSDIEDESRRPIIDRPDPEGAPTKLPYMAGVLNFRYFRLLPSDEYDRA